MIDDNLDNPVLINADCLAAMRDMESNSVDSIVTDPPYGLNFMGKNWDYGVPGETFWKEALRIAKPGTYLLAFGGTRTYHRLACAIEDAGWEIKDCIAWVFGSGFPKSMDVSKAIDRNRNGNHKRALEFTKWLRSTGITAEQVNEATHSKMSRRLLALDACASIATEEKFNQLRPLLPEVPKYIERLVAERTGVEWSDYAKRNVVGTRHNGKRKGASTNFLLSQSDTYNQTEPYSDEAAAWQGWGTCLKPAFEPIVVARKPLEGTVANNVLKYGTGGLNIDACRVPTDDNLNGGAYCKDGNRGNLSGDNRDDKGAGMFAPGKTTGMDFVQPAGRFPANFVHDGSDEVLELFPNTGKSSGGGKHTKGNGDNTQGNAYGAYENGDGPDEIGFGDSGSAARFFYCAKASKVERGEGNDHPTVKPLALMKWLVTLVTPPNGTVLDPFMGSGTTGLAALELNRNFIGIERDEHYFEIAKNRIMGGSEKKSSSEDNSEQVEKPQEGFLF